MFSLKTETFLPWFAYIWSKFQNFILWSNDQLDNFTFSTQTSVFSQSWHL